MLKKMYKIKRENREKLINNRKQKEICDMIGITEQHLSYILTGSKSCKKTIALSLISIKENIAVNSDRMESLLKYYFTEE